MSSSGKLQHPSRGQFLAHSHWKTFARSCVLVVRPFQMFYLGCLVALAIALKDSSERLAAVDIILIWIPPALVVISVFLLNDFMHRDDDIRMRRIRLFSTFNIPSSAVLAVGAVMALSFLPLVMGRPMLSTAILLCAFAFGMMYGHAKYRRWMKVAYLFRTLTGACVYAYAASVFGFTKGDIPVVAFVGLWDLHAHLAGDLRDLPMDQRAGVRTFPRLYGEGATLASLCLVQAMALGVLFGAYSITGRRISWEAIGLGMLLIVAGWACYKALSVLKPTSRYPWLHACFHGPKVLILILLAADARGGGAAELAAWIAISAVLWLGSYVLYLWSDHRLNQAGS